MWKWWLIAGVIGIVAAGFVGVEIENQMFETQMFRSVYMKALLQGRDPLAAEAQTRAAVDQMVATSTMSRRDAVKLAVAIGKM